MYKIFTLFFVLRACFSQAQTPITLSRADFPCPSVATCGLPDSVLFTNLPANSTVTTNVTGPNINWDMSTLTGGTTAYQNFLPMSATPLIFQLVFLSCDYVQPLLGNSAVGGLPVTDAFEYYNYAGTGNTRLEIKGFGAYVTIPGTTTPVPLPAIYTSPDVIYRFPLNYGDIDSSSSGYTITIPLGGIIGDITFKRDQKRINEVDGWGNISTPAGTFSVLRVKSTINRIDSLITGLLPFGFPSNPIEYKWLGSTKKIPVFQVLGTQFSGNFTPTTISYWGEAKANGLTEVSETKSLKIFPNPGFGQSSLEYSLLQAGDVDFVIMDMQGVKTGEFHFKNQSAGNHTEFLPMSQLSSGNYIIQCISSGQVITEKFVKL